MDENWDNLRYFLALARAGTITEAGARLKVSHTTVLRRVRQLEDSVQVRLFDRTPEGCTLTDHGTRLLAEVERMECSLAAASRDIAGADTRIEGTVAITSAPLLAARLLPPIVAGLKRAHPSLNVELRASNQVADLSRREADIALRLSHAPSPSLVGRRVGELGFVVCASADYLAAHPTDRAPDTLDGHRFVVDEAHLPFPPMRWLTPHLGSPSVTLTDCISSTAALCRAGLGLALLPAFVAAQDDLVVVDPHPMDGAPVWVLTHPDLRSAARIRATMTFVGDALRALLADPPPLRLVNPARAAG